MSRNGAPSLSFRRARIYSYTYRMNCVSLDTIGLAGFGHDFGALRGENGIVEEAFDKMSSEPPKGLNAIIMLLAVVFPQLLRIPTKRQQLLSHLNKAIQKIAEGLLFRTRKDAEAGTYSKSSRSIMGALSTLSADSKDCALTAL